MINPSEDYEQNKIINNGKQRIIVDETKTNETDELYSSFYSVVTDPLSVLDPEKSPQETDLDGEGINESQAGLNTEDQKNESSTADEDPGLNRNASDDLSLNKSENDLF